MTRHSGNKVGYTKQVETKVVRTKHLISYWLDLPAGSLKQYLSNVPDDAKLVDISNFDEYNFYTTLFFLEEEVTMLLETNDR